ncbi:MAG: efflux RND transporter permease subunit, partial [Candidatus Omnitrophica bacterium]|nr:efflux RND transporter permease subunit [Candidatus Omnitrophota bacterium]
MANLIFFVVFVGGIIAWNQIPKEELPDITFDNVRISVDYPGASAEDVEYFVTRPVEEAVRSLDGIHRITSSTGGGSSVVTVEIEKDYPDKDEVITEIRNVVLDVDLPDDIKDDPTIRVFKTSRKAIIDIGLIFEGKNILSVESRSVLQSYALALENKLLSLPEVSSVSRSGYLDDEIHIKAYPEKLIESRIPFNTLIKEIQSNNVRQPAGNIENLKEPKVTLYGELDNIKSLEDLAIQGGFEGQVVRLKDVADVLKGYEKTKTVIKINGHEGIFLRATKSSQVGIIDAIESVTKVVKDFQLSNIENGQIKIIPLDDESFDVRNRISLILLNGLIGFSLILLMLFLFLDFRSGLWVAMGIPFTFCFALFAAYIYGYSINNITLAAVIIVMGMVVDDAIVVAENITR